MGSFFNTLFVIFASATFTSWRSWRKCCQRALVYLIIRVSWTQRLSRFFGSPALPLDKINQAQGKFGHGREVEAVHGRLAAQSSGGVQGGSGQHEQEQHSQAAAPHPVAPLEAKDCCRTRFLRVSLGEVGGQEIP